MENPVTPAFSDVSAIAGLNPGEQFAQRVAGHKDRKSTARYYTPDVIKIELPAWHLLSSERSYQGVVIGSFSDENGL